MTAVVGDFETDWNDEWPDAMKRQAIRRSCGVGKLIQVEVGVERGVFAFRLVCHVAQKATAFPSRMYTRYAGRMGGTQQRVRLRRIACDRSHTGG